MALFPKRSKSDNRESPDAASPIAERSGGLRLSGVWRSVFGIVTVSLALLSALATFLVLANFLPIVPTRDIVLSLFTINGIPATGRTIDDLERAIRRELARIAADGWNWPIG